MNTNTLKNPGPATSICPIHGAVWLKTANPVMLAGITLSSDCEYELRCGICGEVLKEGLDFSPEKQ